MVEVRVERPRVPLLWLDTFVLIHAVKGALKPNRADPRITDLLKLVGEKVREGKVICVESDHRREVEGHPRGILVLRKLREQTLGVRMRSRMQRRSFQVATAMEEHLRESGAVRLPLRAFFDRDPDTEHEAVRERGWWLSAEWQLPLEGRQLAEASKQRTVAECEQIRLANRAAGRSRQEQLKAEQAAYLPAMKQYLLDLMIEYLKPQPDLMKLGAGCPLLRHQRTWRALSGPEDGFDAFFDSEHFLAIPDSAIAHRLYADLLTGDQPVKSGDPMDIEHMSAALPTCHWVLTDKAMRHRVQQLGLDKEWGAEVYALKDVDALMGELNAL